MWKTSCCYFITTQDKKIERDTNQTKSINQSIKVLNRKKNLGWVNNICVWMWNVVLERKKKNCLFVDFSADKNHFIMFRVWLKKIFIKNKKSDNFFLIWQTIRILKFLKSNLKFSSDDEIMMLLLMLMITFDVYFEGISILKFSSPSSTRTTIDECRNEDSMIITTMLLMMMVMVMPLVVRDLWWWWW